MPKNFDMIIRINTDQAEVEVEQHSKKGVVTRKNISPQSLSDCIAVVMEKKYVYYYIRYPELYTDFSYYETECRDFPIPRLVFCFKYLRNEHKVAEVSLCVVKDERLTPDTPTYRYPFSNVHDNLSVCLGNNALPVYKDPARLHTLAAYILRMPNNDDLYSERNNQLHAGFRDLLEQMKNKTPAHYYTDVLVKDGKTLKDFLTRR